MLGLESAGQHTDVAGRLFAGDARIFETAGEIAYRFGEAQLTAGQALLFTLLIGEGVLDDLEGIADRVETGSSAVFYRAEDYQLRGQGVAYCELVYMLYEAEVVEVLYLLPLLSELLIFASEISDDGIALSQDQVMKLTL